MPRVVPSDVVKAADRMFPSMVQAATTLQLSAQILSPDLWRSVILSMP